VLSGKSPVAEYLEALEKEIRQSAPIIRERGFTLRSVYIGGGTPTSLSAAQLDKLIGVMGDAFGTFGSEFTVEAGRPDTIDEEKLTVLKNAVLRGYL
jgi:oxygen-independent coproporphyrinogen-3 oxidase